MSTLADLPDGCVAYIVHNLRSVQDVLTFQRSCSRFAAIGQGHRAAWLHLLERDFDMRIAVNVCARHTPLCLTLSRAGSQASALVQNIAANQGQALYKQIAEAQSRQVRYKGCFTDGGVDDGRDLYWVCAHRSSTEEPSLDCHLLQQL